MPRGYAFVYFSKVEDAIRVRAKLTMLNTTTTNNNKNKNTHIISALNAQLRNTHTHDTNDKKNMLIRYLI